MERNTIISAAGAAVGVAALILAIVTGSKVSKINNALNFDTSVDVAIAEKEAQIVSETPEIDTEGMTEEEAAQAIAEAEATGSSAQTELADMNVILRDGVLKLMNSTVKVPMPESNDTAKNIYVYLDGENTVKYDSTTDYLVVNDSIVIKAIDAIDASYNGICQFSGPNGENILIGERKVTGDTAIAVVYTIPTSSDGSSSVNENDVAVVQTILNSAKSNVKIQNLSLFGTQVNPDWAEDIVMTPRALELIKGTSRVYVSPYSGSFAGGTTNTLTSGSSSFTYSDNIKDANTGYSPYIYEFSADQNGTVSTTASGNSMLKVKILAQNNMIMKDLFN